MKKDNNMQRMLLEIVDERRINYIDEIVDSIKRKRQESNMERFSGHDGGN